MAQASTPWPSRADSIVKSLRRALKGSDLHGSGLLTLVLSGIINGLLMFVFCCVFAILVFQDKRDDSTVLKDFLPVGVSMHIFSVMMGSIFYACFTSCKASIAGPDINPALFFALIVESIQLGADSQSPTPVEAILPTSLLAICIGTIVIGVTFLTLGHFKLTRIVQYLPASLLNGFLACIGYKVMKAALTTTCGDIYYKKPGKFIFWKLMLPALPVGFGLYLAKAYHIGQPGVTFPVILLVPLGLFYAALVISGTSLEQARDQCLDVESSASCAGGWFYPEFGRGEFGAVYSTLNLAHVDVGALLYSFSDLPAMLLIVVIDYLLKLAGTKKAVGFDFPFDNEMKTAGMACLASAVGGFSPPAYSQTKFTVLNIGITHNPESRVPGIVTGLFNAVLYFWGFPLINYLPRFFLGGLLIYAGLGFVVDNLIKSWNRVSREEFIAIWTIVIVNAVTSLLVAVVVGIILSAIIFALTYGRIGVVKAFFHGCDYESKVVRSVKDASKLTHLSKRYAIVQMQNYIFFGSAGQILDFTKSLLAEQAQVSRMVRVRYLIFDWTHVYGIDYSGLGVFLDIANVLKKHEVMFVFTGVKENIIRSMLREGILQHGAAVFDHLDLGVEWIEEQLLEWAHLVRSRWLEFRPVVKLHDLARNKAKHDALEEILEDTGFGNELWRFVKRVVIAKGETLCEPGKPAESLYIVQQGKFSSVFADANGNVRKIRSYARGAYINEMAVFTTAPQQHKIIADTENCAVIVMPQYEISRLRASRPNIFMALQQTILRHYWQSNLKLEREISDFEQFAPIPGDLRQQNSYNAEASASVKSRSGKLARKSSVLRRGSSFVSRLFMMGGLPASAEAPERGSLIGSSTHIPSAANMMASFRGSQKKAMQAYNGSEASSVHVEEAGLAFLHAAINLIQKDSERWLIQDELLGAGLTNKVSTGTTLNVLFEGFSSEIELLHGKAGIVRLQAYTDEVHNAETVERPARIREDEEDLCTESTSLGPGQSTRAESGDETGSTATAIKKWEDVVCCKLSKKVEAECRAIFQTYASQNEDGKVCATQVIQMLQDTGHYLSQKEAALLMHGRSWSASSGDASSITENPRMEFMSLLRGIQKEDLTRHIDTAKISRAKQLEFVKLFLSNTAVFADLELSIPGIISAVAERSELLVFHQGECVCAESAPVNSMLVVVDGMVTVRKGTTKRTMHASQSPVIFGEDLVFLPVKEVGTFSSSAEIASTHAVVIEVFRHVLQRAVPQEHSKSRQLQNRAIRLKIEQESRYQLPAVRKVPPVIHQQQRAPFGARYRALASVDLFKESVQADPYLISRVAAETELLTFDQDEFVFRQGDVGDFLLVVVAGDIKVRIRHDNGVSHTHTVHFDESKGGYVLGELAFYTRRHERTADAIVHSETLMALKISRSSLQSIFESSHSIWALIRDRAHKFNHIKDELPSVGVSARLKQIGAQTYRRLINNNTNNTNSAAKSPAETCDDAAPPGSSVLSATNEQSDIGNSSIFRAISAETEKRNRDMQRITSESSQGTVSEADFLNIVSMLTFYPLSLQHVGIIRKVFELYATAPLHRHRHIYGKGSLASAEDLYPEGCITLSNLSSMIEDAGLVLHDKVLAHVMDEWKITDATGYLEPAISFTSLLSIIAAAVKRQRLLLEVETIFKIILANDEVMGSKLKKGLQSVESRAVPTDQKWRRLAEKKIGITPEILRGAWLEFLDVDLSPEAAEEMIFEADESENGFVSFGDWLDSIHSVYQIEVEGTDNFTVFETKMMGLDRTMSTDIRRDDSVSFSTSLQNALPQSRFDYIKTSGSQSSSGSALAAFGKRIASLGPGILSDTKNIVTSARRSSRTRVTPEPARPEGMANQRVSSAPFTSPNL